MSNEQALKEVKGVLLPIRQRPVLPNLGIQFDPSQGQIIDVRTDRPIKPPSTDIIFAEDDDIEEFGDTVVRYAVAERDGATMIDEDIPDATHNTGGVAVKVQKLTFPPGITFKEGEEIIRNEKGTVWLDGDGVRMIVTSLKNPTNPITGEMLTPPTTATEIQAVSSNTNNLLQFPQPQAIPTAEQSVPVSSGNPVATPDNLRQFIRPLTDADLEKVA